MMADDFIDKLANATQGDIDRFQKNLKMFREIHHISAQKMGELCGCTKQTICNLETGRTKMNKMQYIGMKIVFLTFD